MIFWLCEMHSYLEARVQSYSFMLQLHCHYCLYKVQSEVKFEVTGIKTKEDMNMIIINVLGTMVI